MVWKPNIRIMSRAFGWFCLRFPHQGVCPCTQLGDLRPSDRLPTSKSWLRHCSKIVTKYACNHVKCMLSLSCHYNTTPVTPRSAAHFLKCFLTLSLCLNSLSHKPQENCLDSEWTCILRSWLWLNFFWQCHKWTKYIHCVTSADVWWVDYAV